MFDKNTIIWHNGDLKKAKDLSLSIFTHSLHYGTSVFEGMRVYNGKVFKEQEHYERLIKSGELTDIPVEYSLEELINATQNMLKANNLQNGYIRPIVWRGDENLGVKSSDNSVNVAILAWQWNNYFGEGKINQGINLGLSKFVRPDPRSTETQAKASGLYFVGSIMLNKCKKEGYDDVLMLDWRGYVAECSSCNVFFIKNNEIHTPIPDCFLNGITRKTVIDITKKMGYKVLERYIVPQELYTFEEAFVTGTAVEVLPINSIFDNIIMKGKEKSLKIREEYLKMTNV